MPAKETKEVKCHDHYVNSRAVKASGGGAVYGLGFIGAAIYYLQHAGNFTDGLMGILNAFIWPARLIYQVFTTLKM